MMHDADFKQRALQQRFYPGSGVGGGEVCLGVCVAPKKGTADISLWTLIPRTFLILATNNLLRIRVMNQG